MIVTQRKRLRDTLGFLPPIYWMARDPRGRLPASGRTKAQAVAALLAKYPDLKDPE